MPPQSPSSEPSSLTRLLARLPAFGFAIIAALAAFFCYFSMYAFRKPFTAAEFDHHVSFTGSISFKTALVLSQILGYTLSKYIGVKVCSETTGARRGITLVSLIMVAQAALLLFAVLPGPWKLLAMFLNGLPLGMIWGLVVAYLEGRRCSDFVMATLCGTFIVASATIKDIARWLMNDCGINELWMPAATGALFLPLFVLTVYLLSSLPAPNAFDEAARKPRAAMDKSARHIFLRRYAPGLLLLFVFYFFLTAFRDFRDNYGVEIFRNLGYGANQTGIFSRADIPVALISLIALALINAVKNNRLALLATYGFIMLGMLVLMAATLAKNFHLINGLTWMVATGLGTYLAFSPINAVLFERLMAATGSAGTAVFGIQLADSIGYTGSVIIQLYKDLGTPKESHLTYFSHFSMTLGIGGFALAAVGAWYFMRVTRPPNPPSILR